MSLPFSLQFITPWLTPSPFPVLADLSIARHYQVMLASTDSLTRRLEDLTGVASRVRLEHQSCGTLEADDGEVWGPEYRLPAPQPLLVRHAWLTLGVNDWVFAHSELALSSFSVEIRRAVEQGAEPLGTLFLARDASVERLHVCLAACHAPELARRAGFQSDHVFVARRSLFLVTGQVCGRIVELFLMDLSS
ncbi:MAG: chorismate lyase [Magnetococcales bacterium]|nr:chorismate lyase [Magnetococcales bacterium]NGZ04861.1 chorismate lyase [Magnetococcales bacterium]